MLPSHYLTTPSCSDRLPIPRLIRVTLFRDKYMSCFGSIYDPSFQACPRSCHAMSLVTHFSMSSTTGRSHT